MSVRGKYMTSYNSTKQKLSSRKQVLIAAIKELRKCKDSPAKQEIMLLLTNILQTNKNQKVITISEYNQLLEQVSICIHRVFIEGLNTQSNLTKDNTKLSNIEITNLIDDNLSRLVGILSLLCWSASVTVVIRKKKQYSNAPDNWYDDCLSLFVQNCSTVLISKYLRTKSIESVVAIVIVVSRGIFNTIFNSHRFIKNRDATNVHWFEKVLKSKMAQKNITRHQAMLIIAKENPREYAQYTSFIKSVQVNLRGCTTVAHFSSGKPDELLYHSIQDYAQSVATLKGFENIESVLQEEVPIVFDIANQPIQYQSLFTRLQIDIIELFFGFQVNQGVVTTFQKSTTQKITKILLINQDKVETEMRLIADKLYYRDMLIQKCDISDLLSQPTKYGNRKVVWGKVRTSRLKLGNTCYLLGNNRSN
jgi:hypothetical protein